MVLGKSKKDKRSVSLAQQINEAVIGAIRSINVGGDRPITAVRCPDCEQMVRDFSNHGCSGGAA